MLHFAWFRMCGLNHDPENKATTKDVAMKSSIAILLAAVFVAGCSGNNKPAGEAGKPVAPQPAVRATESPFGRAAFQKTFIAARGWQRDAEPYLEISQPTKEVTGSDGKAAVWTASYGSADRGLAKTFTWSGTDAPDAPSRGLNPTPEDSFAPGNSSTHTFDLNYLKSDSDQAFKIAQDHGGKKMLDKNPKLPVFYRLHWESRDTALVWHVMYGGVGGDSKLSVAVNASTGQYIRVEK